MCRLKLENLIKRYAENKSKLDEIKKLTDADNEEIKERFSREGISSCSGGGYVATVSESKKDTLDEEKLINAIKELNINIEGLIKTVEVIDMDILEDAIYNGMVAPSLVAECTSTKITKKLTIKKEK